MAEQQETPAHDPQELLQVLAEIADNSQRLLRAIAERCCVANGATLPTRSTSGRHPPAERAHPGRSGHRPAGAAVVVAGLSQALAERRAAPAQSAGGAGDRARAPIAGSATRRGTTTPCSISSSSHTC